MNVADWLIEGRLLATAHPQYAGGLGHLAGLGIVEVVNLHERPHEPSELARYGLRERHVPVPDFTPPSPEQLGEGVRAIEAALSAGRPIAVHCGAGLGRTGTLLAAYLVHTGLSPDEAIARVRAVRPGSIETPAQEAAVVAFARARDSGRSDGS